MPKKYHITQVPTEVRSVDQLTDRNAEPTKQYGSVNTVTQMEFEDSVGKTPPHQLSNSTTSIIPSQAPMGSATPLTRKATIRVLMASLVACIGSMSVGFNGAYASPAIPDINAHPNPFHVSRGAQSWFVSVAFLSSIVGAFATSVLVDRVGRKLMLMMACLPFTIAWTTIAGSSNVTTFVIARLVSGFSGAVTLTVVSLYIAEIAPASIRGLLMSLHEVLLNVGILLLYVAGAYVHWNWLAIVCVVPPVALSILMVPMPETPRWLLMKGRVEEAANSLRWLRGGSEEDVQRDILQIQVGLKNAADRLPWSDYFRPPLLKYLAISQCLFVLQEFSGVNVVRTYTVTIFQSSGSHLDPFIQTIIVGSIMVTGSVVCTFTIDRFPRRTMLLLSATFMSASLLAMGTFFYLLHIDQRLALGTLYWLPLLSLMVLVFGYTLGFGPLAFVITNEMFPTRARGRACSLGVVTLCLCGFLTTKFFGELRLAIGDFGVFWLCGCICFAGAIFVFFCVPETKGKSLEELEKQLKLK